MSAPAPKATVEDVLRSLERVMLGMMTPEEEEAEAAMERLLREGIEVEYSDGMVVVYKDKEAK